MNARYWTQDEMTAREIQMGEYFAPNGQISTNFFELADEVSNALKVIALMERKEFLAEIKAFYISGTATIH